MSHFEELVGFCNFGNFGNFGNFVTCNFTNDGELRLHESYTCNFHVTKARPFHDNTLQPKNGTKLQSYRSYKNLAPGRAKDARARYRSLSEMAMNFTNASEKSSRLTIQPIEFAEACAFLRQHHRHHQPPQGWKFGMAVNDGRQVVGIAMVGRPVARHLDDGWTLEVTRCCTDGTPHVASKLYAACWRAVKAMGYRRLVTYTLRTEPGTSLRAAGYHVLYAVAGRSWHCPSRPRVDTHPIEDRWLWEVSG